MNRAQRRSSKGQFKVGGLGFTRQLSSRRARAKYGRINLGTSAVKDLSSFWKKQVGYTPFDMSMLQSLLGDSDSVDGLAGQTEITEPEFDASVLEASSKVLIASLKDGEYDPVLEAMKEAEASGKARKTVIAEIEKRMGA